MAAGAGSARNATAVINHVLFQLVVYSPYVSLTRSFEVAETYAKYNGKRIPTSADPAFVYQFEIDNSSHVELVDPVKVISDTFGTLFAANFYQHDGAPDVLLGLVDRPNFGHVLTRPIRTPGGAIGRAPNISNDLHTVVRALRDAEVLACDLIPRACILHKLPIF